MDDKAAKMLFNTLRKSMKLQEGWRLWQIAPKYDWKNLRENYVAERIYRIGQVIENDNTGLIGEIIRRGTNHLICVTEDGIMFKSWLRDVMEVHEVGTDEYREYLQQLTPGEAKHRFTDGVVPNTYPKRKSINNKRKK